MSSASQWPGWRLFATALLVGCGGSFHLGYQIALTNPAQDSFLEFVQNSFTSHYGFKLDQNRLEALWSFTIAILFVGGVFGSLVLRCVTDKLGRKRGLITSFAGIGISSACSIFSKTLSSFELYMLSRFTIGWAITMSLGISGLYLTECSPKRCRGFVSTTIAFFVQLGLVVGSIIALPSVFGTFDFWWLIYLFEFATIVIVVVLMTLTYDSPGYLLQHGYEEEAYQSILFFYNCTNFEADAYLYDLKSSMHSALKPMGMLKVLRHSETRRPTIVGATVAFATTFSGVVVINAFAVDMLRNAGLTIFQASIANAGISGLTLFGSTFSALVVDRFGRRVLLQTTLAILVIVNILVFVLMYAYSIYHYVWISICLIVDVAIFMIAFVIGPGPLCYFITSEMIAQHARSAGQSWASFVQMACRSLILAIFLPLKNQIGAEFAYLLLFVFPLIFCLIFFYYMLPETKNRNISEVEIEVRKLPRLPFRSQRCYQTSYFQQAIQTLPRKDVFEGQ